MELVSWDDAQWDLKMARVDNDTQGELMKREAAKKK